MAFPPLTEENMNPGACLRRFLLPAVILLLVPRLIVSGQEAVAADLQWIDVHMHLIGGRSDYAGAARAAILAMDEAGIRASVVLPPPQVEGMPVVYDIREFRDPLRAYPGRFAFLGGGGTLNPLLIRASRESSVDADTRAQFESAAHDVLAAGAAGFGEISAHHLSHAQGHPYESVAADHPLLLLLADIAARNDAVIDLHFDAVMQDMRTPPRFDSPPNPPALGANFAAFERLLAHNRGARIVWAHAGSDPLEGRTPALSRELLTRHPNLYMSLRFPAGMAMRRTKPPGGGETAGPRGSGTTGMPAHLAMNERHEINSRWIELVSEFPDRFVLGGDQFIPSPTLRGGGPGVGFALLSPIQRDMTRKFLSALAPGVARRVAVDNAVRLYKLGGR